MSYDFFTYKIELGTATPVVYQQSQGPLYAELLTTNKLSDYHTDLNKQAETMFSRTVYPLITTTSKLVVCTGPIRAAYRLSPKKGLRRFGNALLFQAAPHVGLFVFCLLILGTRKRVKVFFYAHLVLCEIFFKLISYIFFDYPFISSYCIYIVTSTPKVSRAILVF